MTDLQRFKPIVTATLVVILGTALCISCIPPKTVFDFKEVSYNNNGVKFSHYARWYVTDDSSDRLRHIVIHDGGYQAVMLHITEADYPMGVDLYARAMVGNYDKTLPMEKINDTAIPIRRNINGREVGGKKYEFTNRISLTHTVPFVSEFYEIKGRGKSAIIQVNCAADEQQAKQKEFQLILDTLEIG